MKHKPIKVLLVEDNPGDARLVKETLAEVESPQFELTHVARLSEASKMLARNSLMSSCWTSCSRTSRTWVA